MSCCVAAIHLDEGFGEGDDEGGEVLRHEAGRQATGRAMYGRPDTNDMHILKCEPFWLHQLAFVGE